MSWVVLAESRAVPAGGVLERRLGGEDWRVYRSWSGQLGVVHRTRESVRAPRLREGHGLILAWTGDVAESLPAPGVFSRLDGRALTWRGSRGRVVYGAEADAPRLQWARIPLGPLGEVELLCSRTPLESDEDAHVVRLHWWSTPWSVPASLALAASLLPQSGRWEPVSFSSFSPRGL